MAEQPTGTVTFLFTDIEGSTRLWEQHPETMPAALARHDDLIRNAIEAHGGHVFKTVGDAFYTVFATAQDGLQAAVAAQRSLHREEKSVRVRMALHTGEAVPRAGDYFGPALNRVARLLAAGHGGQVLLSQATAERVRPSLPAETGLRRLGSHRLRDIATTETIFQLLPPDLPTEFPPLNTLDVAFRRGLRRATGIATVILAVVVSLALLAMNQAHRADHQRRLAEARELTARQYLYAAQINLAQQTWGAGNVGRALELLRAQLPKPGQEDLRGFEWGYLARLCEQGGALATFAGHSGGIASVAISPDGKTLASGSDDKTIKLWDLSSRREIATLTGHKDGVSCVVFSPDGKTLASGSGDGTVRLWSLDRSLRRYPGRGVIALAGHQGPINE